MTETTDKRAPMAPAPMRYRPDGAVDWGNMWDSFCVLAREGGPPHRESILEADETSDPTSAAYQFVVAEIIRGIDAVSGLHARAAAVGWVVITCDSPAQAHWLAESIIAEHVAASSEGATLFVPAGQHFTVKGEIKNVITAVAKTHHYWIEHLPPDAKHALLVQMQFERFRKRLAGWFWRSP